MSTVSIPSRLIFPLILIYTTGLLMVFDASSGDIVDHLSNQSLFRSFFRQLVWGGIAVGVAVSAYLFGWQRLFRISHWGYYIWILILLLLVFIPGIGLCVNGASRWVRFGGVIFQPSEFVKILLPLYGIATSLSQPAVCYRLSAFFVWLLKMSVPVFLVLIEPNHGTAFVLMSVIVVVACAVGIPLRFWTGPLLVFLICFGVIAAKSSYVRHRVSSYFHPEADILGKGHQSYQAKIAAGSGGLFGKGPAKSVQKLSYLPEAQNDYIAAIFAEEYGFVGICVLLMVYLWLFHDISSILKHCSPVPFCFGIALFFLLAFQTFMNLAVVSGLLPSTGLNLPFFSQGGSSLIANSGGIGFLLSMMKESEKIS